MAFDKIKQGKILVEIKIVNTEKLLNLLWIKRIKTYMVKKRDVATLILKIDYLNYLEVKQCVENLDGRIYIIKSEGFIFLLGNMRKKLSLVIGGVLFLAIIYYLSTYIWAIEVNVQKNISPFEVRKQLSSIGVKPGVSKSSIDVKEIEKQLENISSEILWLRVRIEGSTLKIVVEEKINPPQQQEYKYGNLVATMDGEIKRIYTFAGRAKVKRGQVVNKGDVVIEGIDGSEGEEYILPPRGIVIANTFYEKAMKVQVKGSTLNRSGERDSDIYISVFGKKIYLKKCTKDFEYYDKIETSGKIFNKVLYYEKLESEINLSEDDAVDIAINDLEKSLLNELARDAKIINKIVESEMEDKDNLLVNVVFVVEQNISSEDTIEY